MCLELLFLVCVRQQTHWRDKRATLSTVLSLQFSFSSPLYPPRLYSILPTPHPHPEFFTMGYFIYMQHKQFLGETVWLSEDSQRVFCTLVCWFLTEITFRAFPDNGARYLKCYYLLTYSTVQSPSWEANRLAASQEIPRISRNPKVHYRTHKRPPAVSILCQPNPIHIPTSHLLEIIPNTIHPSTPRSPQLSLSLRFPHQDPIRPPLLSHTRHMKTSLTTCIYTLFSIIFTWRIYY